MSLENPTTPLGRLYLQHMYIVGNLGLHPSGDSRADAEKMLNHMGIAEGIVGAAVTLLDAESFETFKKDVGLDQDPARLRDAFAITLSNLPDLKSSKAN